MIVAFDGECLMCSRTIRFLADHDPHDRLRFTRLQDPRGRAMAARTGDTPPDSIIVEAAGPVLVRSDAILRILKSQGGPWSILAGVGRLLPRPVRDSLYDFVARHRHRWFGKADHCPVPGEALRQRLLDPSLPPD